MLAVRVFIIFSAYIVLVNCESKNESEDDENQSSPSAAISGSTTVEPKINLTELPEGESRAQLGQQIEKTPPYVGHVMSNIEKAPKDAPLNHPHYTRGRLSGFSLHVDNHHAIVHDDTLSELSNSHERDEHDTSHVMVPAPEHLHDVNGVAKGGIRGFATGTKAIVRVGKNLGGSNFHLTKFKFNPRLDIPKTDHPKLETDKKNFGTDCHMLSYSQSAYSRSSPLDPLLGGKQGQDMAKIHVDKVGGDCDKGFCKMVVSGKSGSAQICSHKQDMGAPILCGHEKKVTYLAHPTITEEGDCHNQFTAFHVPHMIDHIKPHVKDCC